MAKEISKKETESSGKEFLKANIGKEFSVDGSESVWGEVIVDTKYFKKGHKQKFSPMRFQNLEAKKVVKEIKEPKK